MARLKRNVLQLFDHRRDRAESGRDRSDRTTTTARSDSTACSRSSSSLKLVTLLAKTFSPGASGRDMAGVLDVNWTTDRYNAGANYTDIQEAFNAEMGFIPRRDIRQLVADRRTGRRGPSGAASAS